MSEIKNSGLDQYGKVWSLKGINSVRVKNWQPSLANKTFRSNLQLSECRNKGLANANRPCDCSVLCLHPKSSLCSCPHWILDMTSFGSADSVCRASNNRVGQFKPILQVEGNTFRPIFFYYFIADWLHYNSTNGSFHITKLCSRLCWIGIKFYPEKLKNRCMSHPLGDYRGKVLIP